VREAVFESEIVVHCNALLMVVLRGYTSRCFIDHGVYQHSVEIGYSQMVWA